MKYSLYVGNDDGAIVEIVNGSVGLVSYAGKADLKELDSEAEYKVEFKELDSAGNASRTLLNLTADGETVRDTLKPRLARARKAERPAADETAETE